MGFTHVSGGPLLVSQFPKPFKIVSITFDIFVAANNKIDIM